MCNCIKEICDKIGEAGGYVSVDPPVELISGRVYCHLRAENLERKRQRKFL